ncbi:MAG: hypothetical protein DWQ36_04030 [Acidobacteria bacterium]|nr:MAG: hypothetical protein DWQ30_25285 [Acidobacteriota bacterium]REK10588.1 MAG: hypothetical protein DWQ36_04030 [Acidobacteriota bacterium]
MRLRHPILRCAIACAVGTIFLSTAQPAAASTVVADDAIPRTESGRPDLTGTYDAATLTPLVRPREFGDKLFLTPEEAERIAAEERAYLAERNKASDGDREAPPEGGDGSTGAAGNVGGYNAFWVDRGSGAFSVDGKFRTSILVDPPDGQMPEMTPQARRARAERYAAYRRGNDGVAYWVEEGGPDAPGPYDDMEQRPHAERCLLGFIGATPTFPGLYNNFKRIVQTEDHVMILVEMNHDARVVRMNSEHAPPEIRTWLGDSIGWWEGDTLVVDSTNFLPGTQGRGGSENLHVVERFTLQPGGDLLYRFTVEDPTVWTEPWTGEYLWRASDEKVFEYACHEGNYALGNIMRGARLMEADAAAEYAAGDSDD